MLISNPPALDFNSDNLRIILSGANDNVVTQQICLFPSNGENMEQIRGTLSDIIKEIKIPVLGKKNDSLMKITEATKEKIQSLSLLAMETMYKVGSLIPLVVTGNKKPKISILTFEDFQKKLTQQ